MMEILIICSTIMICFFSYLYYKANEVYVDEIIKRGDIVNSSDHKIGEYIQYKRTYKNGKVTFFEKNYK